jgi:hypothetical protein
MGEFERLKKVNAKIMGGGNGAKTAPKRKQSKVGK